MFAPPTAIYTPAPGLRKKKKVSCALHIWLIFLFFLASDETPYQKSSKPTEDSDDEDSDADFQIPNETIVITQSPV